jgi:hypothetical protein
MEQETDVLCASPRECSKFPIASTMLTSRCDKRLRDAGEVPNWRSSGPLVCRSSPTNLTAVPRFVDKDSGDVTARLKWFGGRTSECGGIPRHAADGRAGAANSRVRWAPFFTIAVRRRIWSAASRTCRSESRDSEHCSPMGTLQVSSVRCRAAQGQGPGRDGRVSGRLVQSHFLYRTHATAAPERAGPARSASPARTLAQRVARHLLITGPSSYNFR